MNKNISFLSGSFFGLFSVLLGAFGAHYLKTILTSNQLSIFETAVRYQMYHAIILCVIGLLMVKSSNRNLLFSSYAFILGILIFSGSLYLYVFTNIVIFAFITPIGGVGLIAGWSLLFYVVWKNDNILTPSVD